MQLQHVGNRWDNIRSLGHAALLAVEESGDERGALVRITSDWINALLDAGAIPNPTDQDVAQRIAATHARAVRCAYDWARSAFAMVMPSELLSASLMATTMPADCVPHLEMPWQTWVIPLPKEQLYVRNMWHFDDDGSEETRDQWVEAIWVFNNYAGATENGAKRVAGKVIYCQVAGSTFAGPRIAVKDWSELAEMGDVLEPVPDAREALSMAGRLVLGCVAELNNSGISHQTVRDKTIREKRGLPKSWVFRLTRPVKVDCREWVRQASSEKLKEKRKLPTVQRLVRGHWKPRLSERIGRLVTVAPYWKGPEDAPVAVSPHIL